MGVEVRLQGSDPRLRVWSEANSRAEARPPLKFETDPGLTGLEGSPLEADTPRGMQEVSHPGVHGSSRLQKLVPRLPGCGSSSRTVACHPPIAVSP